MALTAEVFTFFVHVMAVRTFQLILIVRRHMRILRLHILRLGDECRRRMTLRALLDVRRIKFRRIPFAVTHFTGHAARRMHVGAEFLRRLR